MNFSRQETQEKKTKKEGKKKKKKDLQKTNQNSLEHGSSNVHINNYLKCKLDKCSNQNTQLG